MGLDVYLYEIDELSLARKKSFYREREKFVDQLCKNYKCTDLDAATGEMLDELYDWEEKHGPKDNSKQIELSSKIYPEHLFKIGYLRSSYNSGGINRILRDTIGKDLYYIFEVEDEYEIFPDWKQTLSRAIEVRDLFAKYCSDSGGFDVLVFNFNSFIPMEELVSSPKQALEVFQEKLKSKPSFGNFGCREGDFFLETQLQAHAVIMGTKSSLFGGVEPCVYVITNDTKENERSFEWYQQALEITVEMCEWVLSTPDPKKYILHWSG